MRSRFHSPTSRRWPARRRHSGSRCCSWRYRKVQCRWAEQDHVRRRYTTVCSWSRRRPCTLPFVMLFHWHIVRSWFWVYCSNRPCCQMRSRFHSPTSRRWPARRRHSGSRCCSWRYRKVQCRWADQDHVRRRYTTVCSWSRRRPCTLPFLSPPLCQHQLLLPN